jgi:hypothetical protein
MTPNLTAELAAAHRRDLERAAARAFRDGLRPRRTTRSQRLATLWTARPRRVEPVAACCAS